jgi:hypothetical protein
MAAIGSDLGVSPPSVNLNNLVFGGDEVSSLLKSPVSDTTDKPSTTTSFLDPAQAPVYAEKTPDKSSPATAETYSFSPTVSVATTPIGTTNVSVGTTATNTTSATAKGANEADVTSFKADMAKVDAYTGKSASTPAERAANVLAARKNLTGQKLAEFDANVKPLAQKWGVNLGQPSYVSDASGMTDSQKAVSSAYTAEYNGTKKATSTPDATTAPVADTKTTTPAKKSTGIQGNVPQKFSDSTSEELRKINGSPNYMIDAALVEGNANSDGNKVTKAGLSKVVSPQAAAELNAYVFKGKEFASATDVRDQLRAAYEGDKALRR